MKISCTQENLNQGLFVVSHVASKSTSLPILSNILIKVADNTITLMATDLEIGVSCQVRGKVERDGEFTVQSRLLADYINLLPKERVDLVAPTETSQDQVLAVTCKSHATKIKGQPSVDFPVIPTIDTDTNYTIDAETFRQAISQVIFAVSANETRPEINGVLFSFANGELTLAATDSYRLAEKRVSVSGSSQERRLIVPVKALQEVTRILGNVKDPADLSEVKDVKVYVTDNQILFSIGSIELVSRLIEGQYPDYRQIIPQQTNTTATIEISETVKATKTTSLFARSGIFDVHLNFKKQKKELVLSSVNSQLGESRAEVGAEVAGQDNEVVVNYRYFLDGLQNIDTDQVEIRMIDASNPLLLSPVGSDSDYLYIIMPIKQ